MYIFYRISCINDAIKDFYIGSTTDFTKRKYQHKYYTNNPKYNSKCAYLYKTINNNGGWDNWVMEIIDCKLFDNIINARIHETKLIEEHKSSLNKIRAFITEEQRQENVKKWLSTHKEHTREKQREWNAKNPNYKKEWNAKNSDRVKAYNKKYADKRKKLNPQTAEVHPLDLPLVQDAPIHSCETHQLCESAQSHRQQS